MFNFLYACFMLFILLILLFSADVIPNHSNDISLAVPSTLPDDASNIIDPSFLGFAFEQASFYNYSWNPDGSPNVFSQNLIDAVFSRTKGTPILRVGGTSGDRGHYNATQGFQLNRPATHSGPAFRKPFLSIGPSYFQAFKNFPNAKYIFMVPLDHRDLNNTIDWARQGLPIIGDRLQALEIGNEPDVYHWWNMTDYVNEFLRFQKALVAEFPDQLGNGPIFQALDGVWKKGDSLGPLTVKGAMDAGINSTGRISTMAYHLYQIPHEPGSGLAWLQWKIANHTSIKRNMRRFADPIKYMRKHSPGARFILSENGNTLGHKHREQRNNFATALWNVDYQLHAMAMGVDRVNNQQIIFPGYHMWTPVDCEFAPKQVWPNYYSQPFLADFIGPSGRTQVSEIEIPGHDLLAAYVAYEDGAPMRIAIVNFDLWTPLYHKNVRPHVDVDLTGLWGGIKAAEIRQLTNPEGAYGYNFTTWRGLQWNAENDGQEVRVGRDSILVGARAGIIQVRVPATSAVMVELQSNWDVEVSDELVI